MTRGRSPGPVMGLKGLAAAGLAALLGGCVYFNALYNAERIYGQAERDRLGGRTADASARYDSVVTKAARAFRRDPDGAWADDALYLLGRAHLRRGEPARAAEALSRALEAAPDPLLRRGITLHLGVAIALEGDRPRGLELLHEALREVEGSSLLAEGHLWRGRILLASGLVHEGWWDLDRAAEADPRLRVPADLERVVWGVALEDSVRARQGLDRLLAGPAGFVQADTVAALVREASGRWSPASAAGLLGGLDDSVWPADQRARLRLLRASLRLESGDTAAARADLLGVAEGFGPHAREARLALAGLTLGRAETVEELDPVRPVLLSVAEEPRPRRLLEAIRTVELLDARAGEPEDGDPLALFAAAELARDELAAPLLARSLFLEYARLAPGTPWAGKALLAALSLGSSETERRVVRERLERMRANPYVRASRVGDFPPGEFSRLEEELRERLADLRSAASSAIGERGALLRLRADTMPS